jgi:hypothetical protein
MHCRDSGLHGPRTFRYGWDNRDSWDSRLLSSSSGKKNRFPIYDESVPPLPRAAAGRAGGAHVASGLAGWTCGTARRRTPRGPRAGGAAAGKLYAASHEGERRYSPPDVVEAVPLVFLGDPDEERICTSHVERQNRTIRMQMRPENAFSKK